MNVTSTDAAIRIEINISGDSFVIAVLHKVSDCDYSVYINLSLYVKWIHNDKWS